MRGKSWRELAGCLKIAHHSGTGSHLRAIGWAFVHEELPTAIPLDPNCFDVAC
jgi:hypothetical protein